MDKYRICEFKTEELYGFTDKDEALKTFAQLKEDDTPGVWQLFCNCKMIDEFIGGLATNKPAKKADNFTINNIVITSYWYDAERKQMLFYTTFGRLTAEISMSPEQYKSICQSNPSLEAMWNALADLFGDETVDDGHKCLCPNGGDETNDCEDCAYSPDYHFVDGECVERTKTLENNKKNNMAYWDIIDEACYEAVRGVAASSQTEINEDELEEAVIDIGAEIRDIIIEKLKAIGGKFPFVDENY